MYRDWLVLSIVVLIQCQCSQKTMPIEVAQWNTIELEFISKSSYSNPYTDIDFHATFVSSNDDTIVRPGFWDGDNVWKIRFCPSDSVSNWTWITYCSNEKDRGLNKQKGQIIAAPYQGPNRLLQNGLLRMSDGKRNVVHHNGEPFLVVGDTPWALPFRATTDHVKKYAADRQNKGFNAALLMTVQPDMKAEGPEERDVNLGFMRGFRDLHEGHINQINPSYYQYFDTLIDVLLDHEIVPVYQPVFHGFGWKGLDVLGNHIDPDEYVRYCQYLLARYGSKPALWLLAGDNGGDDPGVKESGDMMEKWDYYQQPTGLHYNPCDDFVASWAVDNPLKHCEHYNKVHQSEEWLDFQWAQTGHSSEHQYHKVSRMYENIPTKASANGEPTYEGMNDGRNGLGWWQGEEAWMQLMSGGTMGVVYGAAGLWQWKVTENEIGWGSWANQAVDWQGAMEMEGSIYVGIVGQILRQFDMTDIQKRWDLTTNNQPLLAKQGELYVSYLNEGGSVTIEQVPNDLPYHWFDPRTGDEKQGMRSGDTFTAPSNQPWVLIIGQRASEHSAPL